MGSKRIGLLRAEALIENLKTEGRPGNENKVPDTVRAASSAAQLTEGIYVRVDSTNNSHKTKMFLASHVGQLVLVHNVDSGQDVVLRNNADDATLATLGEGALAFIVATAAGDNWTVAGAIS
tara:strand:+ start:110 stop:475 length:366 start_codon:yes stop_codon:yes gene_type:complete